MSGTQELNSQIEIREAGIDDLAQIFHLGEKVFTSQEYSNLYRTWTEYEVTSLFNMDTEYCLVAEHRGKVVGFILGTIIEKSRSAWSYGHLMWMGVEPKFSKRGVGGLLFDHFAEIMREAGVRMLLVDTQADNKPAIKFFQKKGFVNPTDHVYLTLNMVQGKTRQSVRQGEKHNK